MNTVQAKRIRANHLVIDCDPGCDDAMALLMAFDSGGYREIDILSVAGNVGVNQTTENACRVAYLANRDAPTKVRVYKGCAVSLDGLRPSAASVHGRDGLGDVPDSVFLRTFKEFQHYGTFRKQVLKRTRATERYLGLARDSAVGTRDLVCTGPLTNLASFLIGLGEEEHLGFWRCFSRVVIMAGALQVQGNISFHGEFNAYADPLALKIVLDSIRTAQKAQQNDRQEVPKVVLVTLDVTEKLNLLWDELEPLMAKPNEVHAGWTVEREPVFTFVCCMLQKYSVFHGLFARPASMFCSGKKAVDFGTAKRSEVCDGCTSKKVDCDDLAAFEKDRRLRFDQKRLLGSAGLKAIPRFCQLHDPLALYAIMHEEIAVEEVEIFASSELGTTRGRIQRVEKRPFFFERTEGVSRSDGTTTVHVIDAAKFIEQHRARFLGCLKLAIGLQTVE